MEFVGFNEIKLSGGLCGCDSPILETMNSPDADKTDDENPSKKLNK